MCKLISLLSKLLDLKFGGFLKKVVLAKTKKEEINKLTSLVKTV